MKLFQLFLKNLSTKHKDFLNLLDLTAKVHGEKKIAEKIVNTPIWGADFFGMEKAHVWNQLEKADQDSVLVKLSHSILREAYFIECAGMAYAAKMNLSALSKEERQFYCFVAEEEAKHLRMVESLSDFSRELDQVPSFAQLIGQIIQDASRMEHLLLIQILLEGWGLYYYKSLSKGARQDQVVDVFKAILKDEIRHHSSGVLLFGHLSEQKIAPQEYTEFLSYLEQITLMIKIGPWTLCQEVFSKLEAVNYEMLKQFLVETKAVEQAKEKMAVITQLMEKVLPPEVLKLVKERGCFTCLELDQMTEQLEQSLPEIFGPALVG